MVAKNTKKVIVMALFTQQTRKIKIHTPLGPDKLLLSSMNGTEGISQLFSFELFLLSEDSKIVFSDIIGVSLSLLNLSLGNPAISTASSRASAKFPVRVPARRTQPGFRTTVRPWSLSSGSSPRAQSQRFSRICVSPRSWSRY